jgi:CheY-like chemotaxis protein
LAKILVADDEDDIRVFTTRLLTREGHEVTLAEDGEQAITLLENHEYDLVVLDIMMPKKIGPDVVKYMKNEGRLREIPILLFSASGPLNKLADEVKEMVDEYLRKPFMRREFVDTVNKLLKSV